MKLTSTTTVRIIAIWSASRSVVPSFSPRDFAHSLHKRLRVESDILHTKIKRKLRTPFFDIRHFILPVFARIEFVF